MIHQHTMTQLKTVQDSLKILKSSNITTATAYTTETVQATQPVTTSNYVVLPAGSLNYLKLFPLLSSSANSPTIRVTGWSKDASESYWIPFVLFEGAISGISGTATTVNSASLYQASTFAKTDGDAKIYSTSASTHTGMLLIDTLGCQLVKIEFKASSSTTANAFYGFI